MNFKLNPIKFDNKISFIIPIYNVEKYLKKCLDSICNQTVSNWEAILVDDGSTDNSKSICFDYIAINLNFKYIHQSNQGQGIARNNGLRVASGSFICFVDPDDWIEKETAEDLLNIINGTDADFINFGLQYVSEIGRKSLSFNSFSVVEMHGRKIFECALLDNQIYTSPCNKIYRTSFLIKNNILFPHLRAYEDILFSRLVSLYATKCLFTRKIYYNALIRSGSTSRKISVNNFILAVELIELERSLFIGDKSTLSDLRLFDQHILKFTSFLIIQAAFRVVKFKEFKNCINVFQVAGFYKFFSYSLFFNRFSLINKLIVFFTRNIFLIRFIALFLSWLRIRPY